VELIWTQPPPPARQRNLGRPEIVAAAMAVADEGGAEAVTMKAVAARLGPYTPMALYRYVGSKDGLVDLMLDAAIAEVALPPSPGGDWRADLVAVATGTRAMVARHPWYAALVHTRPPAGPHTMRRLEFLLRVLVSPGATVDAAMTYAAMLDRHIFGSALQEAQEARFAARYGLEDAESLVAAVTSLHDRAAADGQLPLLTSWLAKPSGDSVEAQFTLGLRFLLDGIAAELAQSVVEMPPSTGMTAPVT
jgi:AcrR family transcriptional regulator